MINETAIDIPSLQQTEVAPLGEVLLAARDAKHLTQQDVSNSLRLSIKQITALENNNFSVLPEPMITRGFIRNYARLLGVDAEPLLTSYRMRIPDKSPSALSLQSSISQVVPAKDRQPWLKYVLSGIFVLLFLLCWFFYIEYMPQPIKKASSDIVMKPLSSETTLPEAALPVAERAVGGESSVSQDIAISNDNASLFNTVPAATDSTMSNQNTLDLRGSVLATTPVQIVPDSKVTAQADANMTTIKKVGLSFSEKAWAKATDKSGKIIYEEISAAGDSDVFEGEPPFNVVIGNANATKLIFLGKLIDLMPYTKNNVARLMLE